MIVASALLLILSALAPYIFTIYTENPRFDFTKTGPIGDTIGGLMNPFIALAGVFITFLAFYMQLNANQIQIDFFNSNQEEQINLLRGQMFFRMIDGLNQRIINLSYKKVENNLNSIGIEYVSYKALDNIIEIFLHNIEYKCISLGRQILASSPEIVEDNHYFNILEASAPAKFATFEDSQILKKSIIEKKDFNERWEYIKRYVGSSDSRDDKKIEALKSIGYTQFYKIDFSLREDLYFDVYDKVYREHGGFMDGYLKNFCYIINFISESNNDNFFVDYLKSNISNQELILVFYFCASDKSSKKFKSQIKKINLFDNLYDSRSRFIDCPTENEFGREIEYILNK